jgi:hypothetical protein
VISLLVAALALVSHSLLWSRRRLHPRVFERPDDPSLGSERRPMRRILFPGKTYNGAWYTLTHISYQNWMAHRVRHPAPDMMNEPFIFFLLVPTLSSFLCGLACSFFSRFTRLAVDSITLPETILPRFKMKLRFGMNGGWRGMSKVTYARFSIHPSFFMPRTVDRAQDSGVVYHTPTPSTS